MSRVEIDAGGRKVTVEHEGELAHLTQAARDLWDHTHGAEPPRTGAAIGFVTGQRWQPEHGDNNGGGSYTHRPMRPVVAETGGSDVQQMA